MDLSFKILFLLLILLIYLTVNLTLVFSTCTETNKYSQNNNIFGKLVIEKLIFFEIFLCFLTILSLIQ